MTVNIVSSPLQAVPALIGAFAGAPVLARELETGTFRYAWTQGIGRWRWTLGQAGAARGRGGRRRRGVQRAVLLVRQPFFAAGYAIPFATDLFDLRGVAFAAWTLAAFAIGALAGMLIRRVVPAIAATLAAYAGLALATALFLRQHYMTPLVTTKLNLPGSAWIVSQWYTKGGKFAFGAQRLPDSPAPSGTSALVATSGLSPAQCLSQHGYTQWTSYQPGSRFWPFQLIEGGWLLALSLILIAVTVWLVRRRAA